MYNGIGLTTPRGSGTNGHVQRNWAYVRSSKRDQPVDAEDDIKKLDNSINRTPNQGILDHDRKRKIEVKCIEFEEILEKQGHPPEEVKIKVENYRRKLMGVGKTDTPRDEHGRIAVRDTHQIAKAQQEKNLKLREAFNISETFVEGTSFDSDRKAKEALAKSIILQKELDAQRVATTTTTTQTAAGAMSTETSAADKEKHGGGGNKRRYDIVLTPPKDRDTTAGSVGNGDGDNIDKDTTDDERVSRSEKKKKKKRNRDASTSIDRKKDKKKKSKKHKKERNEKNEKTEKTEKSEKSEKRNSYEKERKKKRKDKNSH